MKLILSKLTIFCWAHVYVCTCGPIYALERLKIIFHVTMGSVNVNILSEIIFYLFVSVLSISLSLLPHLICDQTS